MANSEGREQTRQRVPDPGRRPIGRSTVSIGRKQADTGCSGRGYQLPGIGRTSASGGTSNWCNSPSVNICSPIWQYSQY